MVWDYNDTDTNDLVERFLSGGPQAVVGGCSSGGAGSADSCVSRNSHVHVRFRVAAGGSRPAGAGEDPEVEKACEAEAQWRMAERRRIEAQPNPPHLALPDRLASGPGDNATVCEGFWGGSG